ncbi:hypothetical protein GCM10010168_02240 [Actinoplanes ianthinogenes]|nr:hypothetical protein GCM10010168_02240 [Actinoplanes ianthinogenes]
MSATDASPLRQNATASAGAAANAISGAEEETAHTATASANTVSGRIGCPDERTFITGRRYSHSAAPRFGTLCWRTVTESLQSPTAPAAHFHSSMPREADFHARIPCGGV